MIEIISNNLVTLFEKCLFNFYDADLGLSDYKTFMQVTNPLFPVCQLIFFSFGVCYA